jgi:tubulin polyglutamylase complex subunit 2
MASSGSTVPTAPADPGRDLLDDARSLFDRLTLGMIRSLERRPQVVDVRLQQSPPATQADVVRWEAQHDHRLPSDLRDFYRCFNGFRMVWTVAEGDGGAVLPLGDLHVNALEALLPLPSDAEGRCSDAALATVFAAHDAAQIRPWPRAARPYHLSTAGDGSLVALVFAAGDGEPACWLQDGCGRWHFLTATFTEYYRRMTQHLGLPAWQLTLTALPLPPAADAWYWQFMPVFQTWASQRASSPRQSLVAATTEPGPGLAASSLDLDKVLGLINSSTGGPSPGGSSNGNSSGNRVPTPPTGHRPRPQAPSGGGRGSTGSLTRLRNVTRPTRS